ncbi:prevent-host-death family protein [Sphingomonas guangdongensis]|uniref:Antitoxin n=1 Tax=Sphingomonas guangdongensis TaxID=1141890 RepID=A0A285QE42_9SPHN|nr:type II toxin-antitoxin system Phd/YefM family antitoxin [Sphingomonas guangdongensis]SOB80116.1 prevent-host-death family protein [Sphingomonas guangdongensis]
MKYISAAEFKAKCLKLMDEVQATGEPITVTKRGKPVAVLQPPVSASHDDGALIGCATLPTYRYDDPFAPAVDPSEWNALNPDKRDGLFWS